MLTQIFARINVNFERYFRVGSTSHIAHHFSSLAWLASRGGRAAGGRDERRPPPPRASPCVPTAAAERAGAQASPPPFPPRNVTHEQIRLPGRRLQD